jgi:hypothetical protein
VAVFPGYRLCMQPEAIAVMSPPHGSPAVLQAVPVGALNPTAAVPVDLAADARWLAWKTRGAAADRRAASQMGWLFVAVVVVVVGGLSLQAW